MSTTQPEALRIADALIGGPCGVMLRHAASDALQRQQAEITRLRAALDDAQAEASVAKVAVEGLRAELARELASRQQAQIDLERAKDDRNRAVIETRRKVAEERAACFGESGRDAVEYCAEIVRTRSDK